MTPMDGRSLLIGHVVERPAKNFQHCRLAGAATTDDAVQLLIKGDLKAIEKATLHTEAANHVERITCRCFSHWNIPRWIPSAGHYTIASVPPNMTSRQGAVVLGRRPGLRGAVDVGRRLERASLRV